MSYCVEYNRELNCRYPSYILRKRRRPLIKKIVYVTLILAGLYGLLATNIIRYLIPGNPEVTAAAFSEMIQQVDNGNPVGEAFLVFCEEILSNAS